MKTTKSLRILIAALHEMRDRGVLEAEQLQEIDRGIRKLQRALRKGNRGLLEAAIDEIAKAFLRHRGF